MTLTRGKLVIHTRPSDDLAAQVQALAPQNPFATEAYLECLRMQGHEVWALGEEEDAGLAWGSYGVVERGRLARRLDVPSLDTTHTSAQFWEDLVHACRARGINELALGSYAAKRCVIPALAAESRRVQRTEYVIDLQETRDLRKGLSGNHRRNINRATKRGVTFTATDDIDACRQHAALQDASMVRRSARGESVPASFSIRMSEAATRSGLGRLYQARFGGRVLSSVLVFLAPDGAYYHTAGTSPEGMACGASQALVHEICRRLQEEAVGRFWLGGAGEENPGLVRFKSGFGARAVSLDSAELFIGNPLRRKIITAVRALRR